MLADNIKKIRLARGLTQQEAAELLGISSSVYSRYETGNRVPPLDMFEKMADIFDVSCDYLLGRESVTESTLTEYERDLVEAFRSADMRAREDAAKLLADHPGSEDK
ncbi:MAG: helix-turn-helix transcriptional regulator [Firmicutes bacterium]|jgi:transcriptional regulator with XRE-family HTH domain|nr:helix-turn-helix transcriptional regulator [Bacillota bacterium]MEE3382652.1 helix-turn-helix transcriptional regulator [Anaerovoracaceae bacterium]MBQ1431340.1 helix-turn-helix transcriptional regulator [Bacillota bacterium]MBQ1631178.1 helix-turn-helix transcriptional regulator [Bacillota bacterium]MBQ1689676.1 helix-turn-helix transcriptional regulator [Bacillota bacterium]